MPIDPTVKTYTEEDTWWSLTTALTEFRVSSETIDNIMGVLRTHVGVGTPLVEFRDIFGNRCRVNMGHVQCWYESSPETRRARWLLQQRLTDDRRLTVTLS